jgi:hypothetical protein
MAFAGRMLFTGALTVIVPALTYDRSVAATMLLVYYVSLIAELIVWVVAVVRAFSIRLH